MSLLLQQLSYCMYIATGQYSVTLKLPLTVIRITYIATEWCSTISNCYQTFIRLFKIATELHWPSNILNATSWCLNSLNCHLMGFEYLELAPDGVSHLLNCHAMVFE